MLFEAPAEPKTLPCVPLREVVVFPHMVVPLFVGRPRSIAALEYAMSEGRGIFLVAQREAKVEEPTRADVFDVGTVSRILQLLRLPDGTVKALMEGRQRGRIAGVVGENPFARYRVEPLVAPPVPAPRDVAGVVEEVRRAFESYARLNRRVPPELLLTVTSLDEPDRLADSVAAALRIEFTKRQELLEEVDPIKRLGLLRDLLDSEVNALIVERKVRGRLEAARTGRSRTRGGPSEARDERDELRGEIAELEARLEAGRYPDEVADRVRKELRKLKLMSPMSAEATVVRNHIEWLLDLPWLERTEDRYDLDEAQRVLDEDHYGLERVKERIVEFLAVRALAGEAGGAVLCLVGPPGVGKTSLAKAIARATGRRFVRLSLGGVRDEAEIRGHRRTYVGAMPGRIVQSLKRAGSRNPVFLLDELDKMTVDFRGDPAAALLEVLDPEQNSAFTDHYIDVGFDLSDVMFIGTANTLAGIPPPLRDRLEIIEIPGYTEPDKLEIARRHLVPRLEREHGLPPGTLKLEEGAMEFLVRRYTREAGVRGLARQLAALCRKLAREIVARGDRDAPVEPISPERIEALLGPPRYRTDGDRTRDDRVGVAWGLAVTQAGGELLAIEVSVMPGSGKLLVTGNLGDVMQESARAALTYVRARAAQLGLDRAFYERVDLHIHCPQGAMPKDGPSAGIAIATAVVSALTRFPVRHDVAMTGEITLRGRVLPIGGLVHKLVAAHRAGMRKVLIPAENVRDLVEVPAHVVAELDVVPVDEVGEVLHHALIVPSSTRLLRDADAGRNGDDGWWRDLVADTADSGPTDDAPCLDPAEADLDRGVPL